MSKQNGNKGRRFDRAFKEEAVRLLQTSGRRQRQIAGDLGISVSALGRWVTELREEDLLSGPHEDAAKEIKRGYEHFAVAECGYPEVAEQYLPIIHLVFANLKTWLIGIHHGVSHQHLQAYLNEFTFRFNRRFYPFNAFRSLLGIAGDTSAPTYAELYSGEWRHPTCSGHGR